MYLFTAATHNNFAIRRTPNNKYFLFNQKHFRYEKKQQELYDNRVSVS
jgi:hypothetical protein